MIKAILFDLDGTLLPMEKEEFTETYFKFLCQYMHPYGYEPKELISAVWQCTKAMIKNDGKDTNENVFWKNFAIVYGKKGLEDKQYFDEFYETAFFGISKFCGREPKVKSIIDSVKSKGLRMVVASSPVFPKVAMAQRVEWAGLNAEDFELITSYEVMSYSKPNSEYYSEILSKLGLKPEECIMVGNDVGEDLPAKKIGMKVFLVSDYLIGKIDENLSDVYVGSYDELKKFIEKLTEEQE